MVGNKFVNIGEIDALELITLDDTLKALVRRGKLWAFNTLFGDQWWADLFGVIQKADYSKSVTVSPSGIIQVIKEYMQRANDISGAVGEEMGSEGIMEMLSEGLSSALETNFNGSLQYILNVWKGSLPPDLSYAVSIGQRLDRVDHLYALSQIAPIGHSPQAILEALISGADVRLREKLATVKEQHAELIRAKNAMMIEHITQAHNYLANALNELVFNATAIIDQVHGMINAIAQEHLARLNQLEDNLEANKARYDAGLISDTKYEQRLNEINIDIDATMGTWNNWMNRIDALADRLVAKLDAIKTDIINTLKTAIADYESVINAVANKIRDAIVALDDDTILKDKALELYADLKAYRKAGFDYA